MFFFLRSPSAAASFAASSAAIRAVFSANSSLKTSFSTLSQLSNSLQNEKNEKLNQVSQESIQKEQKQVKKEKYVFAQLNEKQKEFLDEVIRVDQAGELGANYIYQGQIFALVHKRPELKETLNHMWEQEVHHHNTFNQLQVRRRVRPSLLTPLWKVGAIGLGYVTGSISKEAAMACTVAVETVIGGHYNDQLRTLMKEFTVDAIEKDNTSNLIKNPDFQSSEIEHLKEIIKEFRDQELEHLDIAIENDAESAVPYWLITDVIKLICKSAILTCEKI
ncbi:putative monooxygenase CAT5 [Ascoidea rubescens DSM 1968]|uniref:5-demethoxyubiquinone hydroxylase, mitochondrial n=1 Tax=Ascoidea rubescens DSM 1968 TaxID=1344418 RepID=A0A1D2VBW7_9ASCO|nr:COQ7-domain-containing protein [Ascoidea rubescens DSM 1968]ODV59119.1 COQ7-domain-containing protein [Ascoidea rubescens DSM 1968]